MRRSAGWALAAILLIPLLLAHITPAAAQNRSKRLVLKDGTYQSVTKWDVQGDRVHYYSAERFEWEDMPASLIDWPATEKFNAGVLQPDAKVKAVTEEDERERAAEEAATPIVAPGLRLPESGGVFLLDRYPAGPQGQPQLAEIMQSGTDVNTEKGRNILRATVNPVAGSKQSIELKGLHAKVQAHERQPELYLKLDQVDQDLAKPAQANRKNLDQQPDRYRIVRMSAKKDARVLGTVNVSMVGHVKEQEAFIPVQTQPVSGGWVKLAPTQALEPGEYAVVEMLGPGEMNSFVWDFGVNPAAPANAGAWKPESPSSTATGSSQTPVLQRPPQ